MARQRKHLSKEDILRAMKFTRSNLAAARYLGVSYNHYKKFARTYTDKETGKSLLESHKNQAGKGIPKYLTNNGKEPPLEALLKGQVPATHFNPKKIKIKLINEGYLHERCDKCGFHERRVYDEKIPLILHHKDGNTKNWQEENLEMLCYNCSFLYAVSPISEQQVDAMEDYVERNVEDIDWDLDEHMLEHLQELKLIGEQAKEKKGSKKDGSQYIDRY